MLSMFQAMNPSAESSTRSEWFPTISETFDNFEAADRKYEQYMGIPSLS